MRGARASAALLAIAVAPAADCSFDAYCVEGAAGCVEPGCHDGAKNGDEVDVDCGGGCAPCDAGRACGAPGDCASGHCVGGACCEAPCGVWSSSFGSILDDAATRVVAETGGQIVVVGRFSGAVDLGDGPVASQGGLDAFVRRLDAEGRPLWSKAIGGDGDDVAVAAVATPGGHVVAAVASNSPAIDLGGGDLGGARAYLVELDAQGQHVWSRALPAGVALKALARAADGDLVIGGAFEGTVDFGAAGLLHAAGGYDALVARLDPQGAPRWARRFGDIWNEDIPAVAAAPDGGIVVAATYSRSWSFGGAKLPPAGAAFSLAVAKLDGAGAHLWSHGYTAAPALGTTAANDLAVDDHGDVWVAGGYEDAVAFGDGHPAVGVGGSAFVLVLDANGEERWARGYGEHTASALALALDGRGGALIAGRYKGNVDFGGGIALTAGLGQLFVARLEQDGTAVWARGDDAVVAAGGASLAWSAAAGRLFVAGGYRGTLALAGSRLPSAGDSVDAFVAGLEL